MLFFKQCVGWGGILFYAIIPTLYLCFLLICYPYILLHFNVFYSCMITRSPWSPILAKPLFLNIHRPTCLKTCSVKLLETVYTHVDEPMFVKLFITDLRTFD